MQVDAIDVERFAKEEYPGTTITDISGQDTVILGGNRSGKTLTFNALLYNLLGAKNTIDLTTGRNNSVTLKFTNGASFHRGTPEAEYAYQDTPVTGGEATQDFTRFLCADATEQVTAEEIINTHFLHSHLDRLPLSSLKAEQRVALIRAIVNRDTQTQIEAHQQAHDHLQSAINKWVADRDRLDNDITDVRDELRSAEAQRDNYENLLGLLESGQLATIADELARHSEIREQLSDLYSEREDLRQRKRSQSKLRTKWQRYQEEERNAVIADATNDFVCPVCEDRVSPELATRRLERGQCPFCAEKHDLSELKSSIDAKIDQAEEEITSLTEQIDAITERMAEIDDEITDLQESKPEIQDLDGFVERQLRQNDYQVEGLAEEAEEELAKNQETIAACEQELEDLEAERDALEERISAYRESLDFADERVTELETASKRDDVDTFRDRWSAYYQEMAGDIGLGIVVSDDGDILIPGTDDETRHYDQAGDLSDSEVRLLNISFAVTVNEFAREAGLTEWNTIVLDEPFANLDSDGEEDLITFMTDSDTQFIFTTSDETLQEQFDVTAELERNHIQSTLDMFA